MFDEESEKIERQIESEKNLKMIVDFEFGNIDLEKNQMEIPVIKYKRPKNLKKKEINLKEKPDKNSLF